MRSIFVAVVAVVAIGTREPSWLKIGRVALGSETDTHSVTKARVDDKHFEIGERRSSRERLR